MTRKTNSRPTLFHKERTVELAGASRPFPGVGDGDPYSKEIQQSSNAPRTRSEAGT